MERVPQMRFNPPGLAPRCDNLDCGIQSAGSLQTGGVNLKESLVWELIVKLCEDPMIERGCLGGLPTENLGAMPASLS